MSSRTLVITPNVVFLPGDDDECASSSSKASKASIAVDALNAVFTACASRATSREFWTFIAAHGRDVGRGIDTYLQFKRRPYEYEGGTTSTGALDALSRNVFVTLARVVNDGTYERIDRTLATSDERQRLIDKHALIDVPKLIDVCVLYGRENRELVEELLTRAVALIPKLTDDFIRCGTIVGDNLMEMTTRVLSAVDSGDLPPEAVSDALVYFNDVAVSFVSLVVAYAPAREWVTRDGKLIESLDLVRSMALPSLEGVCRDASSLSAVRDSLNAAISSLQNAHDGGKVDEANAANGAYVGIAKDVVSVIESVRAVLPDVGIGFVKACIDHFGPNAELIVQHLFEDSLPLHLSTLDRNLGWPPVALQTLRKTESTATGSAPAPTPSGYFLVRKVNRDIDLERSAEDHRVLTAMLDLEYEDEYDDSFDDLPVQVANTAIGMDEFDIESSKPARDTQSGAMKRTFYLLGGKVYHAPKEGAEKILATSAEEASSIALARAKIAANQIEGLGAGGNKARFASEDFVPSSKAAPFVPGSSMGKAIPEPREGSSSGRGGRGRGTGGRATRGFTAKDFAHKHHNQKAKAAKKAGL